VYLKFEQIPYMQMGHPRDNSNAGIGRGLWEEGAERIHFKL